jgi:hypothetical protein
MCIVFHYIWNIPSGFATLLAGSFVIIGAFFAWRGIQHQIRSAEAIETARRTNEVRAIEAGFTAELIALSSSIVEATSIWNQVSLANPNQRPTINWPILGSPLFYLANIGRIGLVRQTWVAGALIGFYANILELNDMSRETMAGRPTGNADNQTISARFHKMAANLSQALDGLNDDRKFGVPEEFDLDTLISPDGRPLSQNAQVPRNLQDLLLRLAGR